MRTSFIQSPIGQYLLVTGNYWAFTLTDGALRMLVVLFFHQLGYSPLEVAMLFLFYEFFGVVTNLVGGWLGARIGLNKTMNIGLALQVLALAMLLVPTSMLSVIYVMAAQALSGIAKDLNKMSAKSAIKTLLPENEQGSLYKWVAVLTGSKNALKGCGFFLGGLLLTLFEFRGAIALMVAFLLVVWCLSLLLLKAELGKAKHKVKFKQLFAKEPRINYLSAARMFLFGARDIWFVVALPVYLSTQLAWQHEFIGTFMAAWIIGYGLIQTQAPKITQWGGQNRSNSDKALLWVSILLFIPITIAYLQVLNWHVELVLVIGLLLFGAVFAVNSSLHSYLIVSFAKADGVSVDVGFYYMANAAGRLIGTILSGALYQSYGLEACLIGASVFLLLAVLLTKPLSRYSSG